MGGFFLHRKSACRGGDGGLPVGDARTIQMIDAIYSTAHRTASSVR
jgi:hypothetical protein